MTRDAKIAHEFGPENADGDCPIADLLARLGDKWSLLVLAALSEAVGGQLRFSELMRAVRGISQRMLTTTLRHLERDGILTRQVYAEVPPKVEYTLTARGQELLVPVKAIIAWLSNEWPEIAKSRQEYDERCGKG
jgi:DNA-binding HxlR family transcriptional regulator